MRIKKIEIRSLFGYLDHEIPLNMDDRITIIHGPNGVGKTMVLQLISDLFNRQFFSLFGTPFDRIVVRFRPKGTLTVMRIKEEGTHPAKLRFLYRAGTERTEHTMRSPSVPEKHRQIVSGVLEQMVDNIERVGSSEWYDGITDKIMSFDEVVFCYGKFLPSDIRKSIISVSAKIESVLKQINIEFVDSRRIFTRHIDEKLVPHYRVEQYSEDMVSRIEKCQRESGWLLPRVELFKDIVNSRFSYKKFKVDREKGFRFESNHDGSIVPPGALSSGEQHELVLTYELLFRAPAGSLIFIDEPELSLHVSWQRKFLEDIAKISELADLDFLVATHSPSIVHDRRDLLVRLASREKV